MTSKYQKIFSAFVFTALLSAQSPAVFAASSVLDDTTPPSVVENFSATPGDGEVSLTWDPSTDDVSVYGYYVYIGVSPAEGNIEGYEFGSIAVENGATSYTVDNLTNNLTYYFNVSAYDEAGNESALTQEVEATPQESEVGDFSAPTVSDAEALTSTLVSVEFSEEVMLPEDAASAFSIESGDGEVLNILDAYVSGDDARYVMLVTENQTDGVQYVLTAGISITDMNGNPVESGTSDTAVFTGSSLSEMEAPESNEPDENESNTSFKLAEVIASEPSEVIVKFTQEIGEANPEDFIIQLADDASEEIEVLSVIIDLEDPTQLSLVTEELEAGADYVISVETDLLNTNGESISLDGNEMEFEAPTLNLADLVAPEDVTNLLASIKNESSVLLSWDHSLNSAGDLAEYFVYQSEDGGLSFGDAMEYLVSEFSDDKAELEIDGLLPGETYTFKVSAVDENGNESEGLMTTVTLPESGPGMMAMAGLSLLGAGFVARRKNEE